MSISRFNTQRRLANFRNRLKTQKNGIRVRALLKRIGDEGKREVVREGKRQIRGHARRQLRRFLPLY